MIYLFIKIYSMNRKIISQGRRLRKEDDSMLKGKAVRAWGKVGSFGWGIGKPGMVMVGKGEGNGMVMAGVLAGAEVILRVKEGRLEEFEAWSELLIYTV